jgi:serine/threonine protein phosphatase 1
MIFVIGDVHGEFEKLTALIANILKLDKNPELIFIGDYIDKGEKSLETLILLKEIDKNYPCRYILGNHEFYWLNLIQPEYNSEHYLSKFGGIKTLDSFNSNFINTRETLIKEFDFIFNHLENYIQIDTYLICHCGYLPNNKLMENMTSRDWMEINRYQFLNLDNSNNSNTVIFGHTAFYYPYNNNNKIGIDTGACYLKDQPLTAYCLDEKRFVNSNSNLFYETIEQSEICPMIIRTKT